MRPAWTRPALLLVSMVLAACSSQPKQPGDPGAVWDAWAERDAQLSTVDHWSLTGKLSIDDGEDGGSGRLKWAVSGARSRLEFRGALGRGAWQLEITPGGAQLQKADGRVVHASSVTELVESEVGWRIPVTALQRWVLALPASDAPVRRSPGPDGRLRVMRQHGWHIEYDRYREFHGYELPSRMEATLEERRVKFAIIEWTPVSTADIND